MPTDQQATRKHAFGDDALGDHDAVGLAEEIRAGRVSRKEAVEAAIARTRVLDEQLSALAADRFSEAVDGGRLRARRLLRRPALVRQGQQ